MRQILRSRSDIGRTRTASILGSQAPFGNLRRLAGGGVAAHITCDVVPGPAGLGLPARGTGYDPGYRVADREPLRFDHSESLAPGGGREASIEADDIEGCRIVIGGDQGRCQLEAICGTQGMHAQ